MTKEKEKTPEQIELEERTAKMNEAFQVILKEIDGLRISDINNLLGAVKQVVEQQPYEKKDN